MILKAFITSQIPVAVSINGRYVGIFDKKTSDKPLYDELELHNGLNALMVSPIGTINIPYTFCLEQRDGQILIPSEYGRAVNYGGDNWHIHLNDIRKRFMEHGRLIFSMDIEIGEGKKDSFCVIDDSFLQLLIEHDNKVSRIYLPDTLVNIRPKVEKLDKSVIFALSAQNNQMQYLLVAISNDGKDYDIKIDTTAIKIEQDGLKTMILSDTESIAKRAKVCVYDSRTFEQEEEYYVYLHGSPKITSEQGEIPLALFEAVKCGDLKVAARYLSPELLKDISIEELTDFLFDYVSIEQKTIPSFAENIFCLVDASGKVSFYEFIISNGLVDNIKEV